MRRAAPFTLVAVVSACIGWYFAGASAVRAQSHGISAVSILTADGSRFYMVRDGQVLDCHWEPGDDSISLHPRREGFTCSALRILN
jgi:hypothetical protein